MENYILESNLFDALVIAIRYCKEKDAKISPTFCSGFRGGLEHNLAEIRKGNELRIK